MTTRIADLTYLELKEFIREVVRDQLKIGDYHETERSGEEILEAVRQRLAASSALPTNLEPLDSEQDR